MRVIISGASGLIGTALTERLRADGIETAPGGAEYLGRLISREIAQWTRVVREAGISATD